MSDRGSSLPVRTEGDADEKIQSKLVDFNNPAQGASIDADGNIATKVKNGLGDPASVQVVVEGAAIDPREIRALTNADVVKAQLQDNDGEAITLGQKTKENSLPVVFASDSDPLPVVISVDGQGDEIHDFKKAVALAKDATDNHDYTVTALKTLKLQKVDASASGKIKVEILVANDGVAFVSKAVKFNSTATPNVEWDIRKVILSVPAAGKVRVAITNLDNAPQDVYSTISGSEV